MSEKESTIIARGNREFEGTSRSLVFVDMGREIFTAAAGAGQFPIVDAKPCAASELSLFRSRSRAKRGNECEATGEHANEVGRGPECPYRRG